MALDVAQRPLLPKEDQPRAEQQALRSRMLGNTIGGWIKDLEDALNKHIRPERRQAWGLAECSRNPFRSLSNQVGGVLYQSPPVVRGPEGSEALIRAVSDAGFWSLQQRLSTDLVGIRESLVRVDWSERGGLLYRPVPCELVYVEALPENPDVPVLVEEIQCRKNLKGEWAWAWEILDIRDLKNPVHKIVSGDRSEDWTAANLGGDKSGENYQYRDDKDRPFLPVVMWHAERTGRLWDSFYGIEAVLGTLTIGVLLTFWVHGVKDGSFATVVITGGRIVGLEIENPDGAKTQVISTEPGSFVEVAAPEDSNVAPQVIQLRPGFEPEKLMSAIDMFGAGLAEYAGVSAADLVRTGADPRSGASLSISREGLRVAQGRYENQLRRGDLELLQVTAWVLNAATRTAHPSSGYTIGYPSLPLSAAEVKEQREDLLAKQDAGLMSSVDVYMRLNPGCDKPQAIAELARVAADKALVERATAAALAAAGINLAPPVVDLEVGKAALIPVIVEKAAAGVIPVDAAREILITMGVASERAIAIMSAVKPAVPATTTTT
jgi:hypothetical protein